LLVAAAGVGAVALMAAGFNPAVLWRPEELMTWRNYMDLSTHPLNILALTCLGVLVLATLVGTMMSKAMGRANNRAVEAEEMLDLVTGLRLENEKSWQSPVLKAFAPAAVFASETLGAWRFQTARLKHFAGFEGELRRLQKALADDSREGLSGRYDNPAVGTLADEMMRYFDERGALQREVAEMRERDEEAADAIAQTVQEARCWQQAMDKNINVQHSGIDHLAGHLNDLVADIERACTEESSAAFAAFRSEFAQARKAAEAAPQVTSSLAGLVEKSTKLTFQINMEVARLGARGERLAPMSQSLEEVTTEIRQIGDKLQAEVGANGTLPASMGKLVQTWGVLEAEVKGAGGARWREHLQQYGPAASQLSRNMDTLLENCAPQAARLTQMGTQFSGYAGVDFDAADFSAGNPDHLPVGVVSLKSHTPFVRSEPAPAAQTPHEMAEVDPFAVTPPVRLTKDPADNSFTRSVDSGTTGFMGTGVANEPAPVAGLEVESSFSAQHNPFSAEPELPAEPEKVYDLAEFGAVRLDAPAADTADEVIYELSEFGAVLLA